MNLLGLVGSMVATVATPLETALDGVKTEMVTTIGIVLVPALAIFGMIFAYKRGLGFFKSASKG